MHSIPALSVPTHHSDISSYANSVIDLIFLGMSCAQVTHCIEPDLRKPSDYVPLIIDLSIAPENICVCRMVLKCDSEEETAFLLSVSKGLLQLNFSSLDSTTGLDLLSEAISRLFADCWATYAKKNNVTTWSKEWWNNKCRTTLETYRQTGECSITSLPLTIIIVNLKIPKNLIKSPTLPPGLQDSSQLISRSPDSLNLLSRASSRAGK